jgi:glycosyltransferase involved in cell wall biosynthesis
MTGRQGLAVRDPLSPAGGGGPGPRLGVVVPCYNHETLLAGALAAIVAQTSAPDEVVVIDDGSPPAAAAAIAEITRRHPLVRLLRHESNRGVSAACATGLAAISADYVLFAAADDRLAPRVVEHARAALACYPHTGILFSDNALMDAAGSQTTLFPLGFDRVRSFSGPEFQQFLKRSFFYIATSTVWYRASALRALGGFDERLRWHCDFFAAYALGLWQGATYVPDAVGYFRVSPNSYSAARHHPREQLKVLRAWLAKTAEPAPWQQRPAFRDCGLMPDYDWRALAALSADPSYVTPTLLVRLLTRSLYGLMRPILPIGWRRRLRRLSTRKGLSSPPG